MAPEQRKRKGQARRDDKGYGYLFEDGFDRQAASSGSRFRSPSMPFYTSAQSDVSLLTGPTALGQTTVLQPCALPLSSSNQLCRASLVSSKGTHLGKLVVPFQNEDSLLRVIQELSTVLSLGSGDPTLLARYFLTACLALHQGATCVGTETGSAEPAREKTFVLTTQVAFRLQRSNKGKNTPRDGETRNLQCRVSTNLLIYENGKLWDMVTLDPATGYHMPSAMPTRIRVTQARPDLSCWENGCNGRQFSTLGRLLRHRREMLGQTVKVTCPSCGTSFKRLSARDKHLLQQKCKAAGKQSPPPVARVEARGDRLSLSAITASAGAYMGPIPSSRGAIEYWRTRNERGSLLQSAGRRRGPSPEVRPVPIEKTSKNSNHEPSHELQDAAQPATLSIYDAGAASGAGHSGFLEDTEGPRSSHLMVPNDITLSRGASAQCIDDVTEEAQGCVPGSRRQRSTSSGGSSISETDSLASRCSSNASMFPGELAMSRRDVLVDRIVRWLAKWLDSRLGLLALQSHHGGAAQTSQGSSPSSRQGSSDRTQWSHPRRKPGRGGGQNSDDASDDEGADRPRPNDTIQGEDDEVLEFACPYLKHIAKLKSRKRGRDRDSEYDKWIAAYQVLFPDDYLLPSPYFERTDTGQNRESFLTALREHVGRESPRLIRPRLEEFLDEVLKGSLTPQVLENLLRDVFTQVLNTFPRKQDPLPGLPAEESVSTDTYMPASAEPPSSRGNITGLALQDARNQQDWPGDWSTDNGELGLYQPSRLGWPTPEQAGEIEAGPSNLLPVQDAHVPGFDGNTTLDPQGLMTLFSFDDFSAEYAAWLCQPDETSSRTDSGYFSLTSGGDTYAETGKGKGVVRDAFHKY